MVESHLKLLHQDSVINIIDGFRSLLEVHLVNNYTLGIEIENTYCLRSLQGSAFPFLLYSLLSLDPVSGFSIGVPQSILSPYVSPQWFLIGARFVKCYFYPSPSPTLLRSLISISGSSSILIECRTSLNEVVSAFFVSYPGLGSTRL